MRIKRQRGDHAHRDTSGKRDHGGAEVKMDEVAEFDQHDQKREQHHIHHAPSSRMFDPTQRCRLMPSVQNLPTRQFQQQHQLGQREHDRKQQNDAADEVVARGQQFDDARQNALFIMSAELFDG